MSIELLLTDLRGLEPVLFRPIQSPSAQHAPKPATRVPSGLAMPGRSNDLARERWGVVIPATPAGEERLAWVRPLLEMRQRQCGGGELPVLRAPLDLRGPSARKWRTQYEVMSPDRRPGYLLLLGDLDELSLDLQQELMVSACVGRLCFTTPEGTPDKAGYEAYCAKICSAEDARQDWGANARLLFYAARDGSQAVETGYLDLIRRCYLDARADQQLGAEDVRIFGSSADHQWHTDEADPAARERTLLHWAEMQHPTVLLSMTHGAGTTDPAQQRLRQGALVLGEAAGQQRVAILDHSCFQRSYLPSGFWFLKACFGAGTPTASVYQRWFTALYQLGIHGSDPRTVLTYLAPERPFVARLPQVALARPDGPLGVLGHVDLAWTFGFQSLDEMDGKTVQAQHGPYYDVLRAVVAGSRLGSAVASLSEKIQEIGTHLLTLYRERESGTEDDPEKTLRAWLWMRYLDLAGYILLGDPAAQVPTRAARAVATQPRPRAKARTSSRMAPKLSAGQAEPDHLSPPSATSSQATPLALNDATPSEAVTRMEQAVLAVFRQKQPPSQIAKEAGVRLPTLERWVRTYQKAGQQALSALVQKDDDAKDEP